MCTSEEKLNKIYEENQIKIVEYKQKYEILNKNSSKERIIKILYFSLIPYIAFLCTILFGNYRDMIEVVEPNLMVILMILVSLFLGIITEFIFEKYIWKIKKEAKKFSKANTDKEIFEEMVKYEIYIEEYKNKNIVCDEIINKIKDKSNVINNNNLKKIYKDLDKLSKIKVLNKYYYNIFDIIINIIVLTFVSGMVLMMLIAFPTYFLSREVSINLIIIPFIVSFISIVIYNIKKYIDLKLIITKHHLTIKQIKNKNIECELQNKIDEICNLQNNKNML